MADWDEVKGKAKEGAGEVTGDESLEREGEGQAAWGETKDKAGDAVDEAKDKMDDAKDRL